MGYQICAELVERGVYRSAPGEVVSRSLDANTNQGKKKREASRARPTRRSRAQCNRAGWGKRQRVTALIVGLTNDDSRLVEVYPPRDLLAESSAHNG